MRVDEIVLNRGGESFSLNGIVFENEGGRGGDEKINAVTISDKAQSPRRNLLIIKPNLNTVVEPPSL